MYGSAKDEAAGVLLALQTRGSTDADFERALTDLQRMDEHTARRNIPFVYMVVVDDGAPTPSPMWRKRFAEANRAVRTERYYFFVTVPHPLMRGVVTAVIWLSGTRPGHHFAAVRNVKDAIRALEAADLPYPQLEQLEAQARAALPPPAGP